MANPSLLAERRLKAAAEALPCPTHNRPYRDRSPSCLDCAALQLAAADAELARAGSEERFEVALELALTAHEDANRRAMPDEPTAPHVLTANGMRAGLRAAMPLLVGPLEHDIEALAAALRVRAEEAATLRQRLAESEAQSEDEIDQLRKRLFRAEAERDKYQTFHGIAASALAEADTELQALRRRMADAEQRNGELLALIANDAYAISFQTLGQYRAALRSAAVVGG